MSLLAKHIRKNTKQIFYKATLSSSVGLPIAYMLNVTILPFFVPALQENTFVASAFITIPFLLASIMRIFTIDFIYQKYGINIEPLHLIKKAFGVKH